jgi:hypothetical protein
VLIAAAAAVFLTRSHGANGSSASQPGGSAAGATGAQANTPVPAIAGTASTGPLPSGWQWYTVPASKAGTNAGFKLAMPDAWQVSYSNAEPDSYYLKAPGNNTFMNIDLTPHTKSSMVAEAYYLAQVTRDQGKFTGYGHQSIRPIDARGFEGAAWSFTWQSSKLGQMRALDLMYIAQTSAGQQSFTLYMSWPGDAFGTTLATFTEEVRTFQPVP